MKNHRETTAPASGKAGPGAVSPQELYLWGMYDVAYIKSIDEGNKPGFEIFSADGGSIAFAGSREEAKINIRQMDLEPLSVH